MDHTNTILALEGSEVEVEVEDHSVTELNIGDGEAKISSSHTATYDFVFEAVSKTESGARVVLSGISAGGEYSIENGVRGYFTGDGLLFYDSNGDEFDLYLDFCNAEDVNDTISIDMAELKKISSGEVSIDI